jgi:hypothetical protein
MFELLALASFVILIFVLTKVNDIKSDLDSIKLKLSDLQKSAFRTAKEPKLETLRAIADLEKESNVEAYDIKNEQIPNLNIQKPSEDIYKQVPISKPREPKGPNPIVQFLQENFLIKLGSLFVIIGFGWFMTLAITNNWISPSLQIVVALVIGFAVTAVGLNMNSKNSQTSSNQVFILTGTIIYIALLRLKLQF